MAANVGRSSALKDTSASTSASLSTSSTSAAAPFTAVLAADDLRMGDVIIRRTFSDFITERSKQLSSAKSGCVLKACVVFVGFPFDEGVRRNGGRVGAAGGPDGVRKFLQKMGTVVNCELCSDLRSIDMVEIVDDPPKELTLEEAHHIQEKRIETLLKLQCIPFSVGGGNDQSLANGRGLLSVHGGDVGVVNIDAHLDVRPLKDGKIHSGVPFRLLLQDSRWSGRFIEFAAQGNQCSADHVSFVNSAGGHIVWLSELRKSSVAAKWSDTLTELGNKVFVSFDVDSISGADCPGVSAVATIGLSAEEAVAMAFESGKRKEVLLVDVSEYNPVVEEWRTGRLLTNLFYFFCCGVALRDKQ